MRPAGFAYRCCRLLGPSVYDGTAYELSSLTRGCCCCVQFIPETFDTFFGMLVSPHHAPCHEAVFQAVLHGLASLTDKKLFQVSALKCDGVMARAFSNSNLSFVHCSTDPSWILTSARCINSPPCTT